MLDSNSYIVSALIISLPCSSTIGSEAKNCGVLDAQRPEFGLGVMAIFLRDGSKAISPKSKYYKNCHIPIQ